MPRTVDAETDRKAELAAYMAGELKLQHKEIARRMNTSASNVSRLLSRASRLGCYAERTVREFVAAGVTAARLEQLRIPTSAQRLIDVLARTASENNVVVRRVRVLPVDEHMPKTGTFDERRLIEFGRWAAPIAAELVSYCAVVGVTWGVTIGRIIEALVLYHKGHTAPDRGTRIIPVCAEVEDFSGKPESSSVLAARLQEAITGPIGEQPMLTRVPAFVPKRFLGTDRELGVREMISTSPSYCRVFGTPRKDGDQRLSGGLLEQMDMLVTSVGSAEHPMGLNYNELLSAGEIDAKRLEQLVVGDIGGILIQRTTSSPGATKHRRREGHSDQVLELNRMWTGLQYDALRSLAIAAHKSEGKSFKPGVVVACCGRNRAEILEAVVRRGLANELLLDEDAATALRERLAVGPAQDQAPSFP